MAALIIVDLIPLDKEHLTRYSTMAAESLIPFEGEFLAKGDIEPLHGDSSYQVKVVIQFPDREHALNWYYSDTYQKIIPIRDQGMESQFHLVG